MKQKRIRSQENTYETSVVRRNFNSTLNAFKTSYEMTRSRVRLILAIRLFFFGNVESLLMKLSSAS